MVLTRHELRDCAEFVSDFAFHLVRTPEGASAELGLYELPRRSGEAHTYRLAHPLAEHVVARAKARELPHGEIALDLSAHAGRISALEPYRGRTGFLAAAQFTVEALDQAEDRMIVVAIDELSRPLPDEAARRLLTIPGEIAQGTLLAPPLALHRLVELREAEIRKDVSQRNGKFVEAEAEKLEGWAEDLKQGLERQLKELDREIKEARRAASGALSLEDKLAAQKRIKQLEAQRRERRRSLFDAQDEIDAKRDALIAGIEAKLGQRAEMKELFTVRWRLR
jgi:adenine-specific DNA-methyltransferase